MVLKLLADRINMMGDFLHRFLQVLAHLFDTVGGDFNLVPDEVDLFLQLLFVCGLRFFEYGNALIDRRLKVQLSLLLLGDTDQSSGGGWRI